MRGFNLVGNENRYQHPLSENLYHVTLFGQDESILRNIERNIRDSLFPYRVFLKRARDAEKERMISARFRILEDTKSIVLKKITTSYRIFSPFVVTFQIKGYWYRIENWDEVIDTYEFKDKDVDFYDPDRIELINSETYDRVTLTRDDGNILVKKSGALPENEDVSDYPIVFIRFSSKITEEDQYNYRRVPLVLSLVIDPDNLDEIKQGTNEIRVLSCEEKIIDISDDELIQYTLTCVGLVREDENIDIDGFEIPSRQFNLKNKSSLKNLDKIKVKINGVFDTVKPLHKDHERSIIVLPYRETEIEEIQVLDRDNNELITEKVEDIPLTEIIDLETKNRYAVELVDHEEYIFRDLNRRQPPRDGAEVKGNDNNHYIVKIRKQDFGYVRIQLLEDEDEDDTIELSKKTSLDYFFEDDAEEVMGYKTYDESKKRGMIFKIIGKDRENQILKLQAGSQKAYDSVKNKLNRMLKNKIPIYLMRNTYQLDMQLRAIKTLQESPLGEHRLLLRLCDVYDRPLDPWDPVSPVDIDDSEWVVLKGDHIEDKETQQEFVKIALGTPDFAFLEGPPGSGKTTTILELIFQLIKRNKKVLFAASTHVAIDNVLERLKNDFPEWLGRVFPLRIGRISQVSEHIKEFQINNILRKKKERLMSEDDIMIESEDEGEFNDLILESANLVCGTIPHSQSPLFLEMMRQKTY